MSNVNLNKVTAFQAITERDDEGLLDENDSEFMDQQPTVQAVFTKPIITATSKSKVNSRSLSFGKAIQYNNLVFKEPLLFNESQSLNALNLAEADHS